MGRHSTVYPLIWSSNVPTIYRYEVMNTKTGRVMNVSLMPGQIDAVMVQFTPEHSYGASAMFSMEPESETTIDGRRCTIPGLFEWLSRHDKVAVTVHPCPQRYQMSLKTEFVADTEPEPSPPQG